jgi:hypothetical protein
LKRSSEILPYASPRRFRPTAGAAATTERRNRPNASTSCSKLGLLSATLHFGLRHPVLGEPFAALVRAAADARLAVPPVATDRTLSTARAVND